MKRGSLSWCFSVSFSIASVFTWQIPLTQSAFGMASAPAMATFFEEDDQPRITRQLSSLDHAFERACGIYEYDVNAGIEGLEVLGLPVATEEATWVAEGNPWEGAEFELHSDGEATDLRMLFNPDSEITIYSEVNEAGTPDDISLVSTDVRIVYGEMYSLDIGTAVEFIAIVSEYKTENSSRNLYRPVVDTFSVVNPVGVVQNSDAAAEYMTELESSLRVNDKPMIDCYPKCQCACDRGMRTCNSLALVAYFACLGATLGPMLMGVATCLGACIASGPLYKACVGFCLRIVSGHVKRAVAACTSAYMLALGACVTGHTMCLWGCP